MHKFKNCPYCNQIIPYTDVICKYCGNELPDEHKKEELPNGNINSPIITFLLVIFVFIFVPNVAKTTTLNIQKHIESLEASKKTEEKNIQDNTGNNDATKNFSFENIKKDLEILSKSTEKTQDETKDKTNKNSKPDKDIIHTPNYHMSPIENRVYNAMRKKGYHNKVVPGKKIVIYTNVVDLQCPYQDAFLRAIYKYKAHPDWTSKYTFVEVQHHRTEHIPFNSVEEAENEVAFGRKCGIFCIVDFSNKQYFSGKSNNTKYLYKALYDLYNK